MKQLRLTKTELTAKGASGYNFKTPQRSDAPKHPTVLLPQKEGYRNMQAFKWKFFFEKKFISQYGLSVPVRLPCFLVSYQFPDRQPLMAYLFPSKA